MNFALLPWNCTGNERGSFYNELEPENISRAAQNLYFPPFGAQDLIFRKGQGHADEFQNAYREKLLMNEDTVMIYLYGTVICVQNTAFVLSLAVDKKLNILDSSSLWKKKSARLTACSNGL